MDGDQLHSSTGRRVEAPELIHGLDEIVIPWVVARIDHCDRLTEATAIGVCRGGKLIAGVVYHNYRPMAESMELTMAAASPRWAIRPIIAGLLAYPFRQIGLWSVYTLTPEENVGALRVNEKIGFKEVACIPHGFGRDRAGIMRQMTRDGYEERYG